VLNTSNPLCRHMFVPWKECSKFQGSVQRDHFLCYYSPLCPSKWVIVTYEHECMYAIQLTWPCDGIVLFREVLKVIVLGSLPIRCDISNVNSFQLCCSILWRVQADQTDILRNLRAVTWQVICSGGSLTERLESSET